MGKIITFPELFILIPLITGLLCFILKSANARTVAILGAIFTLVAAISAVLYPNKTEFNNVAYIWLKNLGSSYALGLDGTARILTLLTAFTYPFILASSTFNRISNPRSFYGLMMLAMAGIMGVFCATDALVFYFFWELALIPVYFLCSMWGSEKRVQATYKFFVYTFAGSLLMLIGIIYIYLNTPGRGFEDGTIAQHSFSWYSFISANLSATEQGWLFWLFFAAFAIKMPVFPLHTWQPETYNQSLTPVTMVLSGLLVKMGLFGVIRWLIPILPFAAEKYTPIVMVLCVAGIIYASLLALVQDNMKKLIAYSSIAHIGLMCAAIFASNSLSNTGALLQMFNHGVNIIGMWIILNIIERKTGTKSIKELGGMASTSPRLTIFMVIIALANIALPLTNAFIGEFMMFSGIWAYNKWFAIIAGISIILAAVYTLNLVQKIFYGEPSARVQGVGDINTRETILLACLAGCIFITGVLPQPMIEMVRTAAENFAILHK